MRTLPFIFLLVLLGCDSTTPAVALWQKATETEGGMTFGLHWDRLEGRAEAYRTSKHFMPRLSEVSRNAVIALERASGCKVRPGTVEGDVAILKARIDCG